jgi:peptidoglycan/xylan/chitin deacetylase (PgdA/CDA1 family)
MARDKACEEIVGSKRLVEEKLNRSIDLFAYPNGSELDFNEEIISMIAEAGYSAACTTIPGTAGEKVNPYRLPRLDITYNMCEGFGGRFSVNMFEKYLYKFIN